MRREDIDSGLTAVAFEYFYWFSRFEFALKENQYLKSHKAGCKAEPGWDAFVKKFESVYTISSEAGLLLKIAPKVQVVGVGSSIAFVDGGYNKLNSDLAKVVHALKVIRNNLFHGGKHGDKGWDDPIKTNALLTAGKATLDQLASLSSMESDYERYY